MADYKYVSWDQINEVADGNHDLICDMVTIFFQQIPVYNRQLDFLYAKNDHAALGKLAHKIKGSVSLLGIKQLVKVMKEFENNANKGQYPEKYPDYINLFKSISAKATIELNSILSELKTTKP
jgi:HPt (histidine-containing phosphotransfer) domain-containing protein